MHRNRFTRSARTIPLLFLAAASLAALVVGACASDEADVGSVGDPTVDSSTPGDSSSSTDSSTGNPDGAPADAGTDTGCTQTIPSLDAGGACGTMEFGQPAALFGGVDGGDPYKGGYLPPGVYDAVVAERSSASGGSWHETFVVDGAGNYTRIRQIQTSPSDASIGPLTRRSGKYTLLDGGTIRLEPSCATSDDAPVDAGADNLPYEVLGDPCGKPEFRFGVTGIRITLRRR